MASAHTDDRDDKLVLERGRESWKRIVDDENNWTDWLNVGEALQVCERRAKAIDRGIGAPTFDDEANQRALQGLDHIDRDDRLRLMECMRHRTEIADWRGTLTPAERRRFHHPSIVLRKWQAAAKAAADD
jgi:hypothetical protein